jgi:hypothetical protein
MIVAQNFRNLETEEAISSYSKMSCKLRDLLLATLVVLFDCSDSDWPDAKRLLGAPE